MRNIWLILVLSTLAFFGTATAKPWWMRDSNESDFLPPNVAFQVGASIEGSELDVRWVIADGYYLYKRSIQIVGESPDLTVGVAQLPVGTIQIDQYLGTQEIYTQQLDAIAPYTRTDAGAHPMQIKVSYQGCAEAGLCYPPITRVLFPSIRATQGAIPSTPFPWERNAVIGGIMAFFLAGWVLRRGRKLELPAA